MLNKKSRKISKTWIDLNFFLSNINFEHSQSFFFPKFDDKEKCINNIIQTKVYKGVAINHTIELFNLLGLFVCCLIVVIMFILLKKIKKIV